MHSDVSFKRFKQFPKLIWILLFGAFITRGSYYMVWPFLAVILYDKFAITATEVGLLLTVAALISVVAGFLGSTLSDYFGRKEVMFFSGLLYIGAFTMLANVSSITGYAIVITLCSIATEIWRPASSALVGDVLKDLQTRELAMQSLYFMVNVGAAIGPMIGFWLGLAGETNTFYITAIAFSLFLIILTWGFLTQDLEDNSELLDKNKSTIANKNSAVIKKPKSKFAELAETFGVLLQDRVLQCLIVANIICTFIYGQMDSTLIQYLTRAEVPKLFALISSMILTNALVIICSQFILLKIMARLSIIQRIQIGLVLLTISQIWMAVNPVDLFWGWIGAVVVMSLAETILFPTMNVHIDRLAPNHLRGAYFGATTFYSLGYALAPLGGGLILDYLSGSAVYTCTAMLCIAAMYLYSILDSLKRPSQAAPQKSNV